jgi:malate dehydrogenase (oxaloacetate-decarboxylating)(NADP+)
VLSTDPVRFLPIVYDPTVGTACLEFGHIYRKPNGIYLSIEQRGKVKEVLSHWPIKDVRFICVSTGGRILGLGDLGANGMGIPIGKRQLYTACAAVPPEGLLPLLLDCGTDNEKLLADPLYLGFRRKRPSPTDLDSFVLSLCRRCKICTRSAASTLRIGRVRTRFDLSTAFDG